MSTFRGTDHYEELKQLEPALADYEKALEFDPGRFVYRLRRAVTYEALKKFDLALSEYDALRYYEYSEILHTKLQNYPAALVSKIRSYLVSLKEIPETRDTAFLWLRVVSLFFLLPFFMAAVVSTSEKRKFFDLFKIKNIVKLGWECYQRAFFVTFWWLIFGLGFLETSKFFGNRLVMLNGPVFVIGLFIGFHLIAQSFRSEKDALTATDVPTLDDPS